MTENHSMQTPLHHYRKQDVLEDESSVLVRAIRPNDKRALNEAFSRLSDESIVSRFFRKKKRLFADELEYFTELDFVKHVAIGVALLDNDQMLPIGIGRYIVDADQPKRAEIALTVDELYRGIGVATLMIKHLCAIASGNGIQEFWGTMLAENDRVLRVLKRSGHPFTSVFSDGVAQVTIVTSKA